MRSPRGIIGQASEADSEIAHEILEKIEDVAERVTPKRVVFASIMALLIGMASLLAVVWISRTRTWTWRSSTCKQEGGTWFSPSWTTREAVPSRT